MKTPLAIALLAVLAPLGTLPAAEKRESTDAADHPFWLEAKRGYVRQFVPGLTAALQLTAAQRETIAAAREEITNDEGVIAARGLAKSDKNLTDEQRSQGRAAREAAQTQLREKVAAILDPAQKALIERINAAHSAAGEETGVAYAERFASVKGDEAARRRLHEEKKKATEEQFLRKLDGILTADQKEAMQRAATEERDRAARAATLKKL